MKTVRLLVGTVKGVFFLRAPAARTAWQVEGPHLRGRAIYSVAHDGRGQRQRVWAGAASMHWGAVLVSTDDWGRTWDEPQEANVKFPADRGLALKQIWQIAPGRGEEPDTLYCGVQPSALFESRDAGKTWSLNAGLWNHPHRAKWAPGNGGLCLHTVLVDPNRPGRFTVASSTGGVYRSDDGGTTWQVKNRGVRAEFLPDPYPEFGQCVHKIAQHAARPGRLFLQNHWGLYRSDDAGDTWSDIANGVPSDFGFCLGIHPRDPDTAFVVPLHSDEFRCTPEGRLRVYRTKDAGASWQAMTRGLPQKDAFETVVRDGMGVDALDPAGIYFGTRSGKLFGSSDEGRSWRLLAESLPPIVCVKAAVVAAKRHAARKKKPGRRLRRAA